MTMVHRTHDEAPDFSFSSQDRWYAAPASRSDVIPYWANMPPARSRFEGLAALTRALPSTAGDLLGVLLASTFPIGGGGCEVLRPLWAEYHCPRSGGSVPGLEVDEERKARPCATALRNIVAGLGVLFGHPVGVIVATEIEAMSLPSYKRRALVLAAAELVSNSLLHASQAAGRALSKSV
jgi:hypothetical protein